MLFMGIDVGSSGCKTSVIDENGSVTCFSAREYSFTYTSSGCEHLMLRWFVTAFLAHYHNLLTP